MIATSYVFDIQRATDAATLHAFTRDIEADESLSPEAREELLKLIRLRFAWLNTEAVDQKPKPRW